MSYPIVLLDDQGRRVFAFDPDTDPYEVLFYVAWGHPNMVPMCGSRAVPCPLLGDDGRTRYGYCLDCHGIGSAALEAAGRRFPVDSDT